MALPDPDPEHLVLWRDPVLYDHFIDLAPLAFRIRPPQLDEVLAELAGLGEYTLTVHDDYDTKDQLRAEHVCTLRLRGSKPEDPFLVISAGSPVVAAMKVLRSALVHMQRQGDWMMDDIEHMLGRGD